MSSINNLVMEAQVLEALRTCYDPEIPVNIYELGLVYEVNVDDEGVVSIKMTHVAALPGSAVTARGD
jgi:metal-sulfur cluster biosynthetic enzyme